MKYTFFRIIENRKYIGSDGFPAIITKETFEKANQIKKSKDSTQQELSPENDFLKSVTVCKQCGKKISRTSKWATHEKWRCSHGCKIGKYIDDNVFHKRVNMILKKVSDNPELKWDS